MPLLYLVQSAFTIWMMVDCYQRGAPAYWYMMLWVPFGPLVYFFAVKVHDYDLAPLKRLAGVGRPPTVEKLRWELKETASVANQLALALALVEAGEAPAEAVTLFADVLRRDEGNRRARLGLARAQASNAQPEAAIATLDELVAVEPGFADGAAMKMRADLLWDGQHRDEALGDLERLARTSGRMDYRVALARRLHESGRQADARAALTDALESYRHSPRFIQRRDARARREANALLASLASRT
jgi:hypothetical protein